MQNRPFKAQGKHVGHPENRKIEKGKWKKVEN